MVLTSPTPRAGMVRFTSPPPTTPRRWCWLTRWQRTIRRFIVLLLLLAPAWPTLASDFDSEIAPLLQARCLSCHNAENAEGGLRLDNHADAAEQLVPGDLEASGLWLQVIGDEPEMPKGGPPLTATEVESLRRWILAGAPWPDGRALRDLPSRDLDWWSLQPLRRLEPPEGSPHPIDAFLNVRLRELGLVPLGPAEPRTLLRRLYFDLTGLPPTPAQVDEGLRSDYETVVDRLLASPEFGEKWAQHWLDLARYAETHGYDKDKPRDRAWPYRDYVIRSFTDDKPLDRFVREQIAGDVLYPDEPDGVLGLGFLAAGPWDFIGHVEVGEGKVDGRIAKHLDRDEMVSAVFNVFTSTTVQCAQCHHHKFDPVTMEDYYRLHAVFAAVDRADRVYSGLSQADEQRRWETTERLKQARTEREGHHREIAGLVSARLGTDANRLAELESLPRPEPQPAYGWHSGISKEPTALKWVQVDLGDSYPIDHLRLHPAFDRFAGIGAGFGFPPEYRVEVSDDQDFDSDSTRTVYDSSLPAPPSLPGQAVRIEIGGDPIRFVRVTATRLAERQNDYIFALAELEAWSATDFPAGAQRNATEADGAESVDGPFRNVALGAAVTSLDSIEAGPRWGRANLTDGQFYLEFEDPEHQELWWTLLATRARLEAELRTPERTARLDTLDQEIRAREAELASFPTGPMVYAVATRFPPQGQFRPTENAPRPIHRLIRGDIQSPGERMRPGMPPLWPSAMAEFDLAVADTAVDPEGLARAALATSITADDNPLLWRSLANRVWQWSFGQPLVGTPNDFGRMGMQPTHPELLDYLASALREDPDRSLKRLVRLLVTSDAYRRSSQQHSGNARIDANNAFRWRADRRRLTAEEFRDAVLASAGRLRAEPRGGPGFRDFVINKPEHSPHYEYHLHDPADEASHRRSIYRFVVRSQPHPFLTALDCADPSLSVPARDESTTSLQALAQWNNRLVETMARALGERIDTETEDPLGFACQVTLARPPDDRERELLADFRDRHGAASLARVLFNLNAFLYLD